MCIYIYTSEKVRNPEVELKLLAATCWLTLTTFHSTVTSPAAGYVRETFIITVSPKRSCALSPYDIVKLR